MLRDNLRKAFDESGLYVKEIAEKSGVNKRTIDDWMGNRGKDPRAISLYAVCKVLGITVEEALEGEAGKTYVRNWVQEEGIAYSPPARISDIVEALLKMEDKHLAIIRGTIGGILEGEKDTWEQRGALAG